MKCPNLKCSKEVSSEWKLCPFCGYEPKKCSNTKHAPRWLPQEAKFCPECGEPLEGVMTSPSASPASSTSPAPSPSPVSKERNVSVGDILCTDNTTVPVSEWPLAGKTAMGVVFYVDDTGKHGWAVHLHDQGKFQWTPTGRESEVYGLKKCEREVVALDDEDGYENTRIIRSEGNMSEFPAAYAVDFANGWYLPALGQLKVMINRIKAINNSLGRAGGNTCDVGIWWSSSQYNLYSAWLVTSEGLVTNEYKKFNTWVRSVRAF